MTSPAKIKKTLHELRVHQIELEIQNEELQRTQTQLDAQRERYFDLYDLAPIGYVTVSEKGMILEANLTAVTMLGVTRRMLVRQPLTSFVIKKDQDIYYLQSKHLFETGKPQAYELRMMKKDETAFLVRMEMTAAHDAEGAPVCRILFSDITERKQAEEKVAVANRKIQTILESINDAFFSLDNDMVITYFNKVAEKSLGRRQAEVIGHNLFDAFPEARGSIFDEKYSLALKKKMQLSFETYFGIAPYENWYDVSVYPHPGGISVYFHLITERKQAEEELRESEERFTLAIEGTGAGLWDWDMVQNQVLYSARWKRMLGYEVHEVEDTFSGWKNLWHPEDCANIEKALDDHLAGKTAHYEIIHRLRHKDGGWRWILTRGDIVKDAQGKPCRWIGTNLDITAQKQAEDLLNVRVRLMEFAASHTLSETLQKTLDEVSEIVHSPIGFYHFIDPDQKTISLQEWSTRTVREFCTAQGKGSHYDVDKAGVWADCLRQRRPIIHNDYASLPHRKGLPAGHAPVIRELVVPIMRDNLVVAILGVGNKPSDYTEKDMLVVEYLADVAWEIAARKNAEEENRNLQERLTRSEKMESLGLLAGGVAHDLNNVLGIVVGYSEMVLDAIDEKSPLRKDLTTIFDGGQRAAAIVDDLLTLARRGVVGKKVLNLNKLIADFKKSPQWSKLLTYHPSVKIQIEMEQDLLNIAASSIHLEKTLYNLVSNASEAMTKGGSISIKTNNRYIDKPISGYDTILEGDYVVLSVSDEGDGISETDLKRIFEPFYTKKIMGRSGTGLGLSVVWGTVKDHQGYIDVQSEEGKGTTFSLYFLITREDIEEESLAVSMSEYLGNGQTLLIVDDVKEQRDLAARLLTSLNYKVSSVSSGEEAIKYLKDHQPDLIVLDMIMDPGMDGLDTYKSVLEINPKQKAIIVSGFSESDRVKEAKVLGAGAYIKKPYIKEKLGLAVKKELARK
jgi:PAS domain S-box-containing protein